MRDFLQRKRRESLEETISAVQQFRALFGLCRCCLLPIRGSSGDIALPYCFSQTRSAFRCQSAALDRSSRSGCRQGLLHSSSTLVLNSCAAFIRLADAPPSSRTHAMFLLSGLRLGLCLGLRFCRLFSLRLLATWPIFDLGFQFADGIIDSLSLNFKSSDSHFREGSIHKATIH